MNLVPTKRKGYLNKLVSNIKPIKENPNFAPAVVEDIKCDPPMQAPAKIMPGPRLFRIPSLVEFIYEIITSSMLVEKFLFGIKQIKKYISNMFATC